MGGTLYAWPNAFALKWAWAHEKPFFKRGVKKSLRKGAEMDMLNNWTGFKFVYRNDGETDQFYCAKMFVKALKATHIGKKVYPYKWVRRRPGYSYDRLLFRTLRVREGRRKFIVGPRGITCAQL